MFPLLLPELSQIWDQLDGLSTGRIRFERNRIRLPIWVE